MLRIPVLIAIILGVMLATSATDARADDDGLASLTACNKGSVPVEVVAVWTPLERRIEGVTIAPGECDIVLNTTLNEAIIGFGTLDENGRWLSLHATSVPDLGTHEYNFVQAIVNGGQLKINILTPDSHNLCVGSQLMVFRLASHQDAEALAAKVRERGEIIVKYAGTG